ncbi:large ribosomal subunit protein uL30y-like isoform X2 [Magnolia sinica]|nr:large ribosomal subunit protein uL30y-like isoform X2 [Magnolia sinica]
MKHRKKKKRPSRGKVEGKLLFIIRIGGTNDMHPKSQKVLHMLRLKHIFDGVFVKANEGLMDMLQRVEPYVTYGYPNMKSVKELVYKKGYGNMDRQRVPLTDNNIIEQALGKYSIICLEDIVHEIATVGRHFKEVVSFLWPFKLNKPEGLLQKKRTLYKDGGDSGDREDNINELISKMN